MRRLATAVCTIPALIGWLTACTHVAPPEGNAPGQAQEQQSKAVDLLGRVKQHYIEINPTSQRITQQTRTVVHELGQADIETIATLVTLQTQNHERTEMTKSEVIVHPKEPGAEPKHLPGGKLVTVRNGSMILVNYEGPTPGLDGKPVVISYKVDESELDPKLASLYGGDLATLKLFDMMSRGNLQFREGAHNGEPVFIIETTRPLAMTPDTESNIELWIGAKSLLVEHMKMEFDQKVTVGKPNVVHGEYEGDFTYEMNVSEPTLRNAFELTLHPNAEDFSDEVQNSLKANPAEATPQ